MRGQVAGVNSAVVYSQSQYFGRIGLGVDLSRKLAGGLSADVTRRRYHDEEVYGSTVDLGVLYRIDGLWSLGFAWRGLTLKEMEYSGSSVGSPWVWNAGAGLNKYRLNESSDLSAVLGLAQIDDADVAIHLGLEIAHALAESTTLSLRTGYNGEGVAVGGGIRWRWATADYSWARLPETDCLNDYGHTISFSLDPVAAFRDLVPGDGEAIEHYRTERFRYYLEQGRKARDNNDYLVAHERLLQAEAFAVTRQQRREVVDALNQVIRQVARQRVFQDSTVWIEARDSIAAIERRWRELMMEQQAEYEQRLANKERQVIQTTIERYRTEIPALIDEDRFYDALGRITYILDHRPNDSSAIAWRERVRRTIRATLAGQPVSEGPEDLLNELDSIFRYRLGIDETASDSLVDVWYQQGINYSREGEYRKAIEEWRKVLQARPEHPTVRQDIEVARRRLNAQTGKKENGSN